MRRSRRWCLLSLASFNYLLLVVQGTCEGNSCPDSHTSATEAGLLGDAKKCVSKTYTAMAPVTTSTPIWDVRWANDNTSHLLMDKYLFALTYPERGAGGGYLYRSEDYGANWRDVTATLPGAIKPSEEALKDQQGVMELYFHWSKPERMFIQGAGLKHWITEDKGVTFTAVDTPGNVLGYGTQQIKIHPTNPNWVLALVYRPACLSRATATSTECASDLFYSKDFGMSWQNLTAASGGRVAAFFDFEWGVKTHHAQHEPYTDTTILATVYEDPKHMKGRYPGWDKDLHFVVSHDFFTSKHLKVAACGNLFELVAHKVFLALPGDCPVHPDGSKRAVPKGAESRNTVALYISGDEGQTFEPACLPINHMDKGYSLVRTHNYTASFVIVEHDYEDAIDPQLPVSNVYSAGADPALFTLSMRRNYRRGYVTDFARVEGLPGVYLANQIDGTYLDNPALLPRGMSLEDFIQTKVTFDGGAQWRDLNVPASYRFARCNGCSPSKDPTACRLHLHGPTAWHYGWDARPSFYSHESAPGVVMAVGNTGDYLNLASDATCTWLSRDGGMTWEDVADHVSIYEFGDHGGILVRAAHESERPTDEIHFSIDEGQCWQSIPLTQALDVQNIRVEPRGASHVFMVHGQACFKNDANPKCTHSDPGAPPVGMFITLDFRKILAADMKDCTDQDYETWSPPAPEVCLLGVNYTMQRRKRDSPCFNGKGWERDTTNGQYCDCGQADVECEYGYEKVLGDCQPVAGLQSKQCKTMKDEHYVESETHRRLVHDDYCKNVDLVMMDTDGKGHAVDAKHHHAGLSGVAKFFIVALVLGIVVVVLGFWWSQFASESTKSNVEEAFSSVGDTFASCFGWLREKVTGVGRSREATEHYFQPLPGGEGLTLDEEDARSPPLFPGSH